MGPFLIGRRQKRNEEQTERSGSPTKNRWGQLVAGTKNLRQKGKWSKNTKKNQEDPKTTEVSTTPVTAIEEEDDFFASDPFPLPEKQSSTSVPDLEEVSATSQSESSGSAFRADPLDKLVATINVASSPTPDESGGQEVPGTTVDLIQERLSASRGRSLTNRGRSPAKTMGTFDSSMPSTTDVSDRTKIVANGSRKPLKSSIRKESSRYQADPALEADDQALITAEEGEDAHPSSAAQSVTKNVSKTRGAMKPASKGKKKASSKKLRADDLSEGTAEEYNVRMIDALMDLMGVAEEEEEDCDEDDYSNDSSRISGPTRSMGSRSRTSKVSDVAKRALACGVIPGCGPSYPMLCGAQEALESDNTKSGKKSRKASASSKLFDTYFLETLWAEMSNMKASEIAASACAPIPRGDSLADEKRMLKLERNMKKKGGLSSDVGPILEHVQEKFPSLYDELTDRLGDDAVKKLDAQAVDTLEDSNSVTSGDALDFKGPDFIDNEVSLTGDEDEDDPQEAAGNNEAGVEHETPTETHIVQYHEPDVTETEEEEEEEVEEEQQDIAVPNANEDFLVEEDEESRNIPFAFNHELQEAPSLDQEALEKGELRMFPHENEIHSFPNEEEVLDEKYDQYRSQSPPRHPETQNPYLTDALGPWVADFDESKAARQAEATSVYSDPPLDDPSTASTMNSTAFTGSKMNGANGLVVAITNGETTPASALVSPLSVRSSHSYEKRYFEDPFSGLGEEQGRQRAKQTKMPFARVESSDPFDVVADDGHQSPEGFSSSETDKIETQSPKEFNQEASSSLAKRAMKLYGAKRAAKQKNVSADGNPVSIDETTDFRRRGMALASKRYKSGKGGKS